jgi:hypothetical protein
MLAVLEVFIVEEKAEREKMGKVLEVEEGQLQQLYHLLLYVLLEDLEVSLEEEVVRLLVVVGAGPEVIIKVLLGNLEKMLLYLNQVFLEK